MIAKPPYEPSVETPNLDGIEEIVARLITLGVGPEAVEPVRDWVRDQRTAATS